MKTLGNICTVLFFASAAFAVTAVGTVHGTVKKVDSAAHTVVIKTKEGAERTLHLLEETGIYGAEATDKGWRGLKEGSEVVAHYTVKGSEKTAVEIDNVGKEGLNAMDGALVRVDKGAKTAVVKGADGAEHAFEATDNAVVALGKEAAKGTEKSAKVTVYYTEEGGKKVAHFFQRL